MDNSESARHMKIYLKKNNISFFQADKYEGCERLSILLRDYSNSPDTVIEAMAIFFEDCIEWRVFYSYNGSQIVKDACRNTELESGLMTILNYINTSVWICSSEGRHLYTPRIYLTQKEFDISMTTVVPYELFDLTLLETADFLIVRLPVLMNAISPAIFGFLLQKINLDTAINFIKINVLGETLG